MTTCKWSLPGSLRLAFAQHAFFMIVTALILDGGHLFRCFTIALFGHGVLIGFVTWRRSTTSVDLLLVRYGYLPIALIVRLWEQR